MWNTLWTMKLLVIVSFCFALHPTQAQSFNEEDLEYVQSVHRSYCGTYSLCSPPEIPVNDGDAGLPGMEAKVNPLFECCKSCSCNTSTCFDFGNCCPDILDTLPTLEEAKEPKRVSCQLLAIRDVGFNINLWMYGLCSPDFSVDNNQTAAAIKSRCEQRGNYFDLDSRLPVIDPVTQRVYANKFCAICGFVNESLLIPATPRLACYNGDRFSRKVTMETLIKDVIGTKGCDIEFEWPSNILNLYTHSCRQMQTGCNMTGLWKTYDPRIEAACYTYRADYDFEYNNIFCYLCNEVKTKDFCAETGAANVATVSFAAILDFSTEQATTSEPLSRCSSTQIYDHYKGECRELTCIFPRIVENGECVNIGESITEVAYELQLKFQPSDVYEALDIDTIATLVKDYSISLLATWNSLEAVINYKLSYKTAFMDISNTTSEIVTNTPGAYTKNPELNAKPQRKRRQIGILEEDVDASPLALSRVMRESAHDANNPYHKVHDRDRVHHLQIRSEDNKMLTVAYILLQVEWYFTQDISGYQSKDFLDKVLEMDKTNITLRDQESGKSFSFDLLITGDVQKTDMVGIKLVALEEKDTLIEFPVNVQLPNADEFIKHVSRMLRWKPPVFIPIQTVHQTLICPLVTLGAMDFNITETSNGLLVDEFNTTFDKRVYKKEPGDQNDPFYYVCKDAFVSVTEKYKSEQSTVMPPEIDVTPQGVLSVVCACISILCSFITLITYLLFRELRTQPGINNMLLCVYLICAQSFFTFASPQYDTVSEFVCSLLGALTHFFWLMVVFSMNVCCYYMFTVFGRRSASRNNNDSRVSKTIYFTVYCVCSSLVFVAINIAVVFVDTNQEETGYGGGLCYISRPEMVGYVFALPLGIILLINLSFFLAVVIKISRSPTVSSSNKKDRNYFKIYAKLSSITGLTWIFGFLFQFTHQVVFEYIFIILNGGIGVFIFLSFVLNKRVHDLYRSKFAGKESTRSNKERIRQEKLLKTQETTLSSTSKSNVET